MLHQGKCLSHFRTASFAVAALRDVLLSLRLDQPELSFSVTVSQLWI